MAKLVFSIDLSLLTSGVSARWPLVWDQTQVKDTGTIAEEPRVLDLEIVKEEEFRLRQSSQGFALRPNVAGLPFGADEFLPILPLSIFGSSCPGFSASRRYR